MKDSLGFLDGCTRLCYIELVFNIRASTVTKAFFKRYKWFSLCGIDIKETALNLLLTFQDATKMSDERFFETIIKIIDIKHKYTKPYKPQANGKIERF